VIRAPSGPSLRSRLIGHLAPVLAESRAATLGGADQAAVRGRVKPLSNVRSPCRTIGATGGAYFAQRSAGPHRPSENGPRRRYD
jgi:hypothetical protein